MIPYFIVLSLISVLSLVSNTNSKKINFGDYLIIFILVLFSGMRYLVGTDYNLYYNIYNRISYLGPIEAIQQNKVEIGYSYLNYLTFVIFNNKYAIFFIVSLIIITTFICFIKLNSNNFFISIVFFYCFSFFTNSLNIQRQYIATSILIISTYFYRRKSKLGVLITLIAAFLFHRTSIIFIVVYFLIDKVEKNKISFTVLVTAGVIGVVMYDKIISLFSNIFNKYEIYGNKSYQGGIGTNLMILIFLIIALLIMYLKKKKILDEKMKFYSNIYIFGIPFYIVSLKSYLIMRIAMVYFGVYAIILVPEIFKIFNKKIRVSAYVYYSLLMISWFYFYLINQNGVIPYRTIFTNL